MPNKLPYTFKHQFRMIGVGTTGIGGIPLKRAASKSVLRIAKTEQSPSQTQFTQTISTFFIPDAKSRKWIMENFASLKDELLRESLLITLHECYQHNINQILYSKTE